VWSNTNLSYYKLEKNKSAIEWYSHLQEQTTSDNWISNSFLEQKSEEDENKIKDNIWKIISLLIQSKDENARS